MARGAVLPTDPPTHPLFPPTHHKQLGGTRLLRLGGREAIHRLVLRPVLLVPAVPLAAQGGAVGAAAHPHAVRLHKPARHVGGGRLACGGGKGGGGRARSARKNSRPHERAH